MGLSELLSPQTYAERDLQYRIRAENEEVPEIKRIRKIRRTIEIEEELEKKKDSIKLQEQLHKCNEIYLGPRRTGY